MTASPPRLDDPELLDALGASQRLGMLGRSPIDAVVEHSSAFVDALSPTTGLVVDLGSGGGVPGLVIAWMRPDLEVRLVDRRERCTDQLRRLVTRLRLAGRVEVVTAEVVSLGAEWSQAAGAVVTRGFGPPLSTLRAALPLITADGMVVISEPPDDRPDRWPAPALAELGAVRVPSGRRLAVFRRSVSRETST